LVLGVAATLEADRSKLNSAQAIDLGKEELFDATFNHKAALWLIPVRCTFRWIEDMTPPNEIDGDRKEQHHRTATRQVFILDLQWRRFCKTEIKRSCLLQFFTLTVSAMLVH
jgi:hypothetical protein